MIVIDTSIWIDVLRGTESPFTEWFYLQRNNSELTLTDLNLFEVLQGIRRGEPYEGIRTELLRFGILTTGGIDLAEEAASNVRLLRSKGITIRSQIDSLLATFCIREGHRLLHNDRDFDAFEKHLNLAVVRP